MSFFRTGSRVPSETAAEARVVDELAESRDVRCVRELLPFLPPGSHGAGPRAAAAVLRVLRRATPLELASLDQSMRSSGRYTGPPATA